MHAKWKISRFWLMFNHLITYLDNGKTKGTTLIICCLKGYTFRDIKRLYFSWYQKVILFAIHICYFSRVLKFVNLVNVKSTAKLNISEIADF